MPLPDDTLAVLVKRDGKYFAPTGTTILKEKDIMLIIADNHADLMATYEKLGIHNVHEGVAGADERKTVARPDP